MSNICKCGHEMLLHHNNEHYCLKEGCSCKEWICKLCEHPEYPHHDNQCPDIEEGSDGDVSK